MKASQLKEGQGCNLGDKSQSKGKTTKVDILAGIGWDILICRHSLQDFLRGHLRGNVRLSGLPGTSETALSSRLIKGHLRGNVSLSGKHSNIQWSNQEV